MIFDNPTTRSYARLTGSFYLGIAVFGAFAIGYVPSQIVVDGDAAATLANVTARRGLFNAGIGADALVMMLEVMTTTMIYQMFRRVNETLAFAAALARFGMVAVMGAMLLLHGGLLSLAKVGGDPALAQILLDAHHSGVWIWQVFFTLHLWLLGTLVIRSGLYPRLLGLGLVIGGTGYLLDSLYSFAFPDASALGYLRIGLLVIVTLSEVGFALWLVVRGPRGAQ
ncbi:DUF4386 domain-containing protein [Maritimibacter sp. DP1N21-5]|uniref:DUF4386 domain-containing protein n=1 Tax=Maritimibacter sp. DP1N21-5 TaxID=2836867 RepID=UPI001C45C015|nr:DUF4386 domain-containing protein [Maritimibacter sp. DP1N21-5]MBV7407834.1 DUF4386 domain-containing protein [Maritimibacter sp. DP1N21-5]